MQRLPRLAHAGHALSMTFLELGAGTLALTLLMPFASRFGGAFVLFTSYAVLRTVQRFVEMALPYPVLVQGQAPRSATATAST